MPIRTCLAGVALAALAIPHAWAGGLDRPDVVRGLCSPDGCAEFSVEAADLVAQGPDGRLLRTRVRTFQIDHGGRRDTGVEQGYVFCSTTRPAVISASAGKPVTALFLAPDDHRPDWQQRKDRNYYVLYFAMCHGPDAGRRAAVDRVGTARALGYRVPLQETRVVTLGRPEDVLVAR